MNAQAVADRTQVPPVLSDSRSGLISALLLSLLIHAAVAWGVYDKALVRLDVRSLDDEHRVYRIRRAEPDVQTLLARDDDNAFIDQPQAGLGEMSQALLTQQPVPGRGPGAVPGADVREAESGRLDRPEQPADGDLADVGGPQPELVEQLVGRLIFKVPFVKTSEPDGGDGNVQEESPGSGARTEAQQILADTGLVAIDVPAPPKLDPPRPVDMSPEVRRRPDTPRVAPRIDFTDTVFQTVTKIKVPEYLNTDFDYVLHVFRPDKRRGPVRDDAGDYLRVDITGKRSLRKLRTMARDVVFLIDTSGSITQAWIDAAISGVKDALNSLNDDDRFNIVMFKDTVALFNPESNQQVNDQTRQAALQFLDQATSSGYTDVSQVISRLLVRDLGAQRVYDLILISDGKPTRGIKDTRELINIITRDNDLNASIYCVGIGSRQDRTLLEYLAYRNKGFCVFAKNSASVPRLIRDLASRLRYPIIRDVTLTVGGLDPKTIFPREVPNIHQGERFPIYGRFDQLERFTMQVNGRSFDKDVAFTFTRDLSRARPGDEQIAHQWAFWKLHHLYSELIRCGDDEQIKDEIKRLGKRYKLKTVK